MSQRLLSLTGVVSCILLLVLPRVTPDLPQESPSATDEEKLIQEILAAKDPSSAAASFRSLFNLAKADGLRSLQMDPSDTIAIQAAWEEVELAVPEKPDVVVRPDRDKLSRFIGFLEGRGQIQPPQWWSEAILDARANRRGNVYAAGLTLGEHSENQPNAGALPPQASFDTVAGKPVVRVGSESVLVSEDLCEKLGGDGPVDGVCALITASNCYVAAYDSVGYPYKLACVERSSGKLRWVTEVWASWWGNAEGQHHQWVEVTEQGNRVAVFGVASVGFHAEVFRVEDGVNVLRFSNSYSSR